MARREESYIEKQKQSIKHVEIMEAVLTVKAIDSINIKREFFL